MSKRKLIDEFDKKIETRRRGITKFLIFPNLVDEFTKSPLVTILFFVLVYKIYLEVNSIIRFETKIPPPPISSKLMEIYNNLVGGSNPLGSGFEAESSLKTKKQDMLRVERSLEQTTDTFKPDFRNLMPYAEFASREQTPYTQSKPFCENNYSHFERLLQDQNNTDDTTDTGTSTDPATSPEDQDEQYEEDVDSEEYEVYKIYYFLSAIIIIFVLFCLAFGNSPQFNCHTPMVLIFLVSIFLLGMQIYIMTFPIFDFKIVVTIPMLLLAALLGVFTQDRISTGKCYLSSFHANRAYIFNEYCFQKLFQRPSVMWGMRFGKYKRFSEFFEVPEEHKSDSKDAVSTGNKDPNIPSQQNLSKVTSREYLKVNSMKTIKEEANKSGVKTGQITPNRSSQNQGFQFFKEKDDVGLKRNLFSEINSKKLQSDWLKTSANYGTNSFSIDYNKLYEFYKDNNLKHSHLMSRSEGLVQGPTNINNRSFCRTFRSMVTPFASFKRELFIESPYYFPSKLLICLFIQFFITSEIIFNLVSWYVDAANKDIDWVKAISNYLEIPVDSLFVSARIAFVLVTVLFVPLTLYSVYRMLRSFSISVLNMRLNGIDDTIGKSNIWSSTSFIQSYLGNIIFSSFPFLLVFFLFFFLVTNPLFWLVFWSFQRLWIVPLCVFLFDIILDFVLIRLSARGYFFKNRWVIRGFDTLKMFIGFYSGLFTGFMRFFISLLFINITMFRVDKTGLPKWFYDIMNLDLVNNAYHGLLRLYHTHNNPLVHAFIGTIMDSVLEARSLQEDQRKQEKSGHQSSQEKTDDPETLGLKDNQSDFDESVHEEALALSDQSVLVKGTNQLKNKQAFLKVAYRWQYYAFLVRNARLWEFRKNENQQKQEETQNGKDIKESDIEQEKVDQDEDKQDKK